MHCLKSALLPILEADDPYGSSHFLGSSCSLRHSMHVVRIRGQSIHFTKAIRANHPAFSTRHPGRFLGLCWAHFSARSSAPAPWARAVRASMRPQTCCGGGWRCKMRRALHLIQRQRNHADRAGGDLEEMGDRWSQRNCPKVNQFKNYKRATPDFGALQTRLEV